jgi:hypothetical protein
VDLQRGTAPQRPPQRQRSRPVARSQTWTPLPESPEAAVRPSGARATAVTVCRCAGPGRRCRLLSRSQTSTVPSLLLETTRPSGVRARQVTASWCPAKCFPPGKQATRWTRRCTAGRGGAAVRPSTAGASSNTRQRGRRGRGPDTRHSLQE